MKEAFEKILERLDEMIHPKQLHFCKCARGRCRLFYNNKNCMDCVVKDAKEIVQEVAEEYNNGWIACNDRLPNKNGMYLCTQNTYDLNTNKKIIKISTELVEFYNENWRRAKNLIITHWQPLPEPYQPKGE